MILLELEDKRNMVTYNLIEVPDIIPQDPQTDDNWYLYSLLPPLEKARNMKKMKHELRKHIYNRRQGRKAAREKQTARKNVREKMRRRPCKSPDRLTYVV